MARKYSACVQEIYILLFTFKRENFTQQKEQVTYIIINQHIDMSFTCIARSPTCIARSPTCIARSPTCIAKSSSFP